MRRTFLTLLVAAAGLPVLSAGPTAAATAAPSTKCNFLQQLLRQCPKPTSTTTTTTTSTSTTSIPSTACGGVATIPKFGGGSWTCDFGDEFNGSSLDRTMWLPQTTKGSGFDSNDHDCFMDSPNNVSVAGGTLVLTSRQEPAAFV